MAVTDLTNTTWILNDSLTITSGIDVNINFESNSELFTRLYIHPVDRWSTVDYFDANNSAIKRVYSDTWQYNDYKTITITGGDGVSNSNLISWLEANAVAPTLITNLTNTTWKFKNIGITEEDASAPATIELTGMVSSYGDSYYFNKIYAPSNNHSETVMFNPTSGISRCFYLQETDPTYTMMNSNIRDGEGWYSYSFEGNSGYAKMNMTPTITITGGTDATNQAVLLWLEENKIEPRENIIFTSNHQIKAHEFIEDSSRSINNVTI